MDIDYGAECTQHVDMILDEIMSRFGHDAVHVVPEVVENEMTDLQQENDTAYQTEIAHESQYIGEGGLDTGTAVKVLIGDPIVGIRPDAFNVSLSDKLQTEYQVVSKTLFSREDRIDVTMPDGRKLRLRVLDAMIVEPYSSVYYSVRAMVI